MPQYLLRISLEHPTFRIPHLKSIAQTFGFPIRFVSDDRLRSVLIVELEEEEHVQRILDRGTVVMSACRLYAHGSTYDELHQNIRQNPQVKHEYNDEQSWKFTVEAVNYHIPATRQVQTIQSFAYLDLKGRIDMKTPDIEYVVFEDYDFVALHTREARLARDGQFQTVFFGRRIGPSRARSLVSAYSVKTRTFYGNTTMEAEMGFLMAIQALPVPGKIMYDPFAGTGSMLFAAAQFGAFVLGSDIDGRQMRGKPKGKGVVPGVLRAAAQYGIASNIIDCTVFDITKHPLRRGGWVDAIITDPPYGVRAGAKRLGKRESRKRPAREDAYVMPDGTLSHEHPDYIPPFRPYGLVALTRDLVALARYLLVPRGRLVFFLPTVTDEYKEIDIPIVEGMRELKVGEGSVQDFGPWSRRLITMEKTAMEDGEPPKFEEKDVDEELPAHHDFRRRYYESFKPRSGNDGAVTARAGAATSDMQVS